MKKKREEMIAKEFAQIPREHKLGMRRGRWWQANAEMNTRRMKGVKKQDKGKNKPVHGGWVADALYSFFFFRVVFFSLFFWSGVKFRHGGSWCGWG